MCINVYANIIHLKIFQKLHVFISFTSTYSNENNLQKLMYIILYKTDGNK